MVPENKTLEDKPRTRESIFLTMHKHIKIFWNKLDTHTRIMAGDLVKTFFYVGSAINISKKKLTAWRNAARWIPLLLDDDEKWT